MEYRKLFDENDGEWVKYAAASAIAIYLTRMLNEENVPIYRNLMSLVFSIYFYVFYVQCWASVWNRNFIAQFNNNINRKKNNGNVINIFVISFPE